ncbi:MAG: 5-oxoprolinase subunit PxpA [Cyclobacteriaceae bacterium]
MKEFTIDINCDLGEGVGNDHLLMPHLSSCNIACGGHAGDDDTMRSTITLALAHQVKIGAHPSFPDRKNFGRIDMHLPIDELEAIISSQIDRLHKLLEEQHTIMNHIKPHGALYNMAAVDQDTAEAIIRAVVAYSGKVFLYVPFGSVIEQRALEKGIPIKYEAFADRNYNSDLTLVSRNEVNALLKDADEIFRHIVPIIKEQKVMSVDGSWIPIKADTLCIHGDNPNAPEIAEHLSVKLQEVEINIL